MKDKKEYMSKRRGSITVDHLEEILNICVTLGITKLVINSDGKIGVLIEGSYSPVKAGEILAIDSFRKDDKLYNILDSVSKRIKDYIARSEAERAAKAFEKR